MNDRIDELLALSHELGREERRLAILEEGSTSAKLPSGHLAIKASGACLATLTRSDVTVCDSAKVLGLLQHKAMPDVDLEMALLESRAGKSDQKPGLEALFHAWLLSLEGVMFAGHCHPVTCNQILCSPRARDFAERRMFPGEINCCGPRSVFVPYVDPGLSLAREIRDRTLAFMNEEKQTPQLILLQNHGVIAIGASTGAVLATLLMAEKAAAIFVGAASMGGPHFMAAASVERIAGRPDEHHRQRQLKLS